MFPDNYDSLYEHEVPTPTTNFSPPFSFNSDDTYSIFYEVFNHNSQCNNSSYTITLITMFVPFVPTYSVWYVILFRETGVVHPITHIFSFSLFHHAFFNSIMDKTPTHALFTQHYISLAC